MSDAQPRRRKTRTREHVIADLGVNFVERQVLLAGFTTEHFRHDYGLDLVMKTYNATGEVESGQVALQVKATDHFATHADGQTLPVRVGTSDLKSWLCEWGPVILVLYDAIGDRAFWVNVQEYARVNEIDEEPGGETVTIRVPVANILDVDAVGRLRERKENLAADGQDRPDPAPNP